VATVELEEGVTPHGQRLPPEDTDWVQIGSTVEVFFDDRPDTSDVPASGDMIRRGAQWRAQGRGEIGGPLPWGKKQGGAVPISTTL